MENKRAYLWAIVGRFIPQIIYLLTTMFLSRFLTPNDFGMIGVLTVFFTVANVLMDSGLGGSLVKEKEISQLDCSTIFVFNLIISHVIYIVLFLFAESIESFFSTLGLADVVKSLCLVFVINSWGLVAKSLLIREIQFKLISNITIISVTIASLVAIVMAYFNFGVYALVVYQLIQSLISTALFIFYSNFKISFHFSLSSLKRLIPFGIFTTLVSIIDTIYENMITFLFGKCFNMYEAGYLYQAKKLEEVPSLTLTSTINNVAFPILTKHKNNIVKFKEEANQILILFTAAIVPMLLTISIFAKELIICIYGDEWLGATSYLSLLIFAGICILLENINRNFIKSLGAVDRLLKYTIIKRFIGIIVIFLSLLSVDYILYGYILSSFIGFIINNEVYCKLIHEKSIYQLSHIFYIFIPNIIYFCIMTFVRFYVDILFWEILIACFLLILYLIFLKSYCNINVRLFIKNK